MADSFIFSNTATEKSTRNLNFVLFLFYLYLLMFIMSTTTIIMKISTIPTPIISASITCHKITTYFRIFL